jgi:hypothetical protein
MLLTGYTKDVFRPECNPNFTSVHCIAHLKEDVGAALPYLNTVLGGTQFLKDPPELMFHHQAASSRWAPGKLPSTLLKMSRKPNASFSG